MVTPELLGTKSTALNSKALLYLTGTVRSPEELESYVCVVQEGHNAVINL
jgi:hypothetical protein